MIVIVCRRCLTQNIITATIVMVAGGLIFTENVIITAIMVFIVCHRLWKLKLFFFSHKLEITDVVINAIVAAVVRHFVTLVVITVIDVVFIFTQVVKTAVVFIFTQQVIMKLIVSHVHTTCGNNSYCCLHFHTARW